MDKPIFRHAFSKTTTPYNQYSYRMTATEQLLETYLESIGQSSYESFPIGCELRAIARKLDLEQAYYRGISALRNTMLQVKPRGELYQVHQNAEDLAFTSYQNSLEKMMAILEKKGLKDGYQKFLETEILNNARK